MAEFDFTTLNQSPDSLRWGRYAERDVIPLWVADMDFASPPAVLDAMRQRLANGLFTYGQVLPSQQQAVVEHCERQYQWQIEPEWLVWLPGLVPGLHLACLAATEPQQGVFTATPIYPPFLSAPLASERRLLSLPLVRDETGWCWDFAAADLLLKSARLLLFCHPHNPVGRVWRDEELWQIAALAEKHQLIVCSDEIHCDLNLLGQHRPLATLSPAIAARTITLMAPSKTYNLAGLGCAFAIIPDAQLRRRFLRVMRGIVPQVNVLGLVASEAAYRHGEPWRRALLETLRGNARRVEQQINAIPQLRMSKVEATYLAWIDCSGLGIEQPAAFFEQAGVGLSDGSDFAPGDEYSQYVRLNFGTPCRLLDKALERISQACATLG